MLNVTLPIHPTFPVPSPTIYSTSILYICISVPALQIGSSALFFWIPHISTAVIFNLASVGAQVNQLVKPMP